MTMFSRLAVLSLGICLAAGPALAQSERPFIRMPIETAAPLTGELVNAVDLQAYIAERAQAMAAPVAPVVVDPTGATAAVAPPKVVANPAIAKLQILLDQAGASPGVVDGFEGGNLVKAIAAFQSMAGLPADGVLSADVVARLQTAQPVIGAYTITPEDGSALTAPTPTDYAEKAKMSFLGYSSVAEALAERFHMDIDFLKALNPGAQFVAGETIAAVITGVNRTGVVARIDADKTMRQVRAYDANGVMLAAYPATIGSEDNPSPSGTYTVVSVTPMPNYTYNPKVNFQQGQNTEVLTIPPGPNGPVGSMWIALSKPTFGIHGTPEPSLIDKTGSHGCIRLTNWDADELAGMVGKGVVVTFL